MKLVLFPASSPLEKSCACTMTGRQRPIPSNYSNGTSIILHFVGHSFPTIFSCIFQVGHHINHLYNLSKSPNLHLGKKHVVSSHKQEQRKQQQKDAHTHTQKTTSLSCRGLIFSKTKTHKEK